MCVKCQASFDRLRELDDGTMLSVIRWAAERCRLMCVVRLRHAEADAEQEIHTLQDESDEWKKRAESAEYALAPYLCPECKTCLSPKEIGHTMCRKCAEKDMCSRGAGVRRSARYSPLATDLTAREVSSERTEADRDFH